MFRHQIGVIKHPRAHTSRPRHWVAISSHCQKHPALLFSMTEHMKIITTVLMNMQFVQNYEIFLHRRPMWTLFHIKYSQKVWKLLAVHTSVKSFHTFCEYFICHQAVPRNQHTSRSDFHLDHVFTASFRPHLKCSFEHEWTSLVWHAHWNQRRHCTRSGNSVSD